MTVVAPTPAVPWPLSHLLGSEGAARVRAARHAGRSRRRAPLRGSRTCQDNPAGHDPIDLSPPPRGGSAGSGGVRRSSTWHYAVTGLAAWRAARRAALPFFLTFHGSDMNIWPDDHPGTARRPMCRGLRSGGRVFGVEPRTRAKGSRGHGRRRRRAPPGRRPRLDRSDHAVPDRGASPARTAGRSADRPVRRVSPPDQGRPRARIRCCTSRRPVHGGVRRRWPRTWLRGRRRARTPRVRRRSEPRGRHPVHVGSRCVRAALLRGRPPDRPRRGGLDRPSGHRESGGGYPRAARRRSWHVAAGGLRFGRRVMPGGVSLQPAGGGDRGLGAA